MQWILMALSSVPVCCVIKQPLSVTSVKVFQPFPAEKSEEAAGHWRSQSNPTVALLSQLLFTAVIDLHVFKNEVVLLSLNRLNNTKTFKDVSCLIYTLVLFFGGYSDLKAVFPLDCQQRYTSDHQSWTSGISLRPGDYMPIWRNNYKDWY